MYLIQISDILNSNKYNLEMVCWDTGIALSIKSSQFNSECMLYQHLDCNVSHNWQFNIHNVLLSMKQTEIKYRSRDTNTLALVGLELTSMV